MSAVTVKTTTNMLAAAVAAATIAVVPMSPPGTPPVTAQSRDAETIALSALSLSLGGVVDAAVALGSGFFGTAQRAATSVIGLPLGGVTLALALADGDPNRIAWALRQMTDAPLWIADPTISGIANAVDALGGNGQAITDFRNTVLWGLTNNTREWIRQALGATGFTPVDTLGDLVTLGTAAVGSGIRLATAVVGSPIAVLNVATGAVEALTGGSTLPLGIAVSSIVTSPLWVADPLISGLKDVLPSRADALNDVRVGVWQVQHSVMQVVSNALGLHLPPESNTPTLPPAVTTTSVSDAAAAVSPRTFSVTVLQDGGPTQKTSSTTASTDVDKALSAVTKRLRPTRAKAADPAVAESAKPARSRQIPSSSAESTASATDSTTAAADDSKPRQTPKHRKLDNATSAESSSAQRPAKPTSRSTAPTNPTSPPPNPVGVRRHRA